MNRLRSRVWLVILASFVLGCGKGEPSPAASASGEAASSSAAATAPSQGPVGAPSDVVTVSAAQVIAQADPIVVLHTSVGDLFVRLYDKKAPRTVSNFLGYVRNGFYDGTVFHQIVPDYLALTGSFDRRMQPKLGRYPIPNEATNGLKNVRGSLAMAHSPDDPQNATAAFFINLNDNPKLDHRGTSPEEFGYCVFGQVIDGADVLRKLTPAANASEKIVINAVKLVPMRDVHVHSAVPIETVETK